MPKLTYDFIRQHSRLYMVIILCSALWACGQKQERVLHLGVTTTLEDSGLLTLLINQFNQDVNHVKAPSPMVIKPIIVGSGQLFTLIERGDIDIAISHEPKGEQVLIDKGSISQRTPLFYNHFLVVGDKTDPAHIQSSLTIEEAFKKILHSDSDFVSRGDDSGTHYFEKNIWQHIGVNSVPAQVTTTGTGMGATLAIAAERNAYTVVDLGTWLNFENKQRLKVLFPNEHTEYSEELKQQELKNQYSLLVVNSEPAQSHQQTLAQIFEQWILSAKTQALITRYRLHEHTVFFTSSTKGKN